MLVGGSVRDRLLGIRSKDLDLEVYGLEPARLRALLEKIGPVNTVGEHFSVYKLVFYRSGESSPENRERFEVDVSIPRRESKSGRGHRGFIIEGDPLMTFEEAARRRDFTVNAILYDPLTEEIIDPFGGARDLDRRILRAVAADTFVEDSLRVLRAMQLAARFLMEIAPETMELCRTIELSDLPHERIRGEVEKMLLLAERPSVGLQAASDLGILDKLFPEIRALTQSEGHTGGDAFTHTKKCLDEAARLTVGLPEEKRMAVMLAVLLHDLEGSTKGRRRVYCDLFSSEGAVASADKQSNQPLNGAALAVLETLGIHTLSGYDVRSQVLALAREYRKPEEFYRDHKGGLSERLSDGRIRRLAGKVELDLLYRVAKACALGRNSPPVAEDWFMEKARELAVSHHAPAPLLMGRHLIEAGFEPGPRMGEILREVYELQLDGEVATLEEALAAALSERMKDEG